MKGLEVIESSVRAHVLHPHFELTQIFLLQSAEATSIMSLEAFLLMLHHITPTLSVDNPKLCCRT